MAYNRNCILYCSQTIVAQVNHAIGAEGIISTECKEVVREYGEMILELLVAQVRHLLHFPAPVILAMEMVLLRSMRLLH